jgi:iron complex transport system ATP-binding protein
MPPAIETRHLCYGYRDEPVLKDLSFAVDRGDFFILIGPNGSGKTTLMKTMAGILKATGILKVLGRPAQGFSRKALARHIAFVPQQLPMDFPFSVREVILMGRAPHQGILGFETRADRAVAERVMAMADISHLAERRLNCLSGGELQRVFIAKALCQEPEIILLDEPTAFLDLAHQIQVMDFLEHLKQEKGITIVMVSHDLNLAAMYGDRLLLMREGEALSLGTPNEVLTFPVLEAAYGCTLLTEKSPLGDFPRVTTVPGRLAAGSEDLLCRGASRTTAPAGDPLRDPPAEE